ncbi:MAG: cyclic nucleotide-binding domain-containing protein [Cyanobacteria bacterium P01_F01_bin.53]
MTFLNSLFSLLATPTLSSVLTDFRIPIANESFTLLELFTIVGQLVLVWLAARIVGALVKRLIFKPMRLNRGRREAAATILTYALMALGSTSVLVASGLDLNSLTIVAGTVGIGVGIGLQTLASHFMSGLILLFEQPIKVGDFIEVDGLMGTVEKVSARSTIVRTLDRVSVIVPNSRFIENNVVNWSYEDPRSRLHIPVGVAYGSDMMMVTEALLAAARRESRVLRQPSPKIWFKAFGDSSLNFELLVWIDNPIETQPIQSALNYAIHAELRSRGIEVPFPQRDLNIKDIDRFQAMLQPEQVPVAAPASVRPSIAPPMAQGNRLDNINLRELLRRVSYFEHCRDWELRQLIEYGYRQSFRKGEIVFKEGALGSSFYIVLSGSVEVYLEKLGQKVLATRGEGEFFGEMSLLLDAPRSASIRALEETLLFVVERSNLQPILQRHQELADYISEELSDRTASLEDLGVRVGNHDAGLKPIVWIRRQITKLFELS